MTLFLVFLSCVQTACSCRAGFQGSGKFCFPVNPCRTVRLGHWNYKNQKQKLTWTLKQFEEDRRWFVFIKYLCVCVQNNGGCSKYANCEYLGQGQRNCTCLRGHLGDGFDCRGNTNNVSLVTSDLSLLSSSPSPDAGFCPAGVAPSARERLLSADVVRESPPLMRNLCQHFAATDKQRLLSLVENGVFWSLWWRTVHSLRACGEQHQWIHCESSDPTLTCFKCSWWWVTFDGFLCGFRWTSGRVRVV